MGEKEEITLSRVLLLNLIMTVEPGDFSQAMLRMQGLGTISTVGDNSYWIWDKERIGMLDDNEILKLINELTWK